MCTIIISETLFRILNDSLLYCTAKDAAEECFDIEADIYGETADWVRADGEDEEDAYSSCESLVAEWKNLYKKYSPLLDNFVQQRALFKELDREEASKLEVILQACYFERLAQAQS